MTENKQPEGEEKSKEEILDIIKETYADGVYRQVSFGTAVETIAYKAMQAYADQEVRKEQGRMLREYGEVMLEKFKIIDSLQAYNDKLVEALHQVVDNMHLGNMNEAFTKANQALSSFTDKTKEVRKEEKYPGYESDFLHPNGVWPSEEEIAKQRKEFVGHWGTALPGGRNEKINNWRKEGFDKAINWLKSLQPLQQAGNGWISVEDKLPIIWGDFIVTTGNWVGSCHYDGKFYDYSVNKMKQSSRYELPVTHWMPLPEPPSTYKKNNPIK